MARFTGTVQEFHHFIGPRLRNVINQKARPAREALGGVCQECGAQATLESAHIHGRGRRRIIEAVLSDHTRPDGWVDCDLEQVESEILEAHLPIEDTFMFICRPCHVAYDAGKSARSGGRRSRKRAPADGDGQFRKLHRIELWAGRPLQANHRIIRAFMHLAESGDVQLTSFRDYCSNELGIEGFDGKYASLKTDACNSYGKVFFDDGVTVEMWPIVRREVERHF